MNPQRSGAPWRSLSAARGLCMHCWTALRGTDALADYEPVRRSRDDLLDDYVLLRDAGYDWPRCAELIGMPYMSFQRAMLRARKAGDPRARRIGEVNYPAAGRAA